jgi:hypothetical protein
MGITPEDSTRLTTHHVVIVTEVRIALEHSAVAPIVVASETRTCTIGADHASKEEGDRQEAGGEEGRGQEATSQEGHEEVAPERTASLEEQQASRRHQPRMEALQ